MVINIIRNKEINLILQGGGVKGLAYIGALRAFENYGYKIKNISGTSIGAVIGCLVIAGYNSYELEEIVNNLDYKVFMNKNNIIDAINNKGIFSTKYLEQYLENLLIMKNIRVFKDVKVGNNYKVMFITTSIKYKRIFVLPYDLTLLNINPDTFPIAKGAIMSCSIPFFYEPYKILNDYFYDGGVSDNLPSWCFNNGIALKVSDENKYYKVLKEKIFGKIQNYNNIEEIKINTKNIKSTDFKGGLSRKYDLYNEGYKSVKNYIKTHE